MNRHKQTGQALVEFALTLPLMCMMVSLGYDGVNMVKTAHHLNQAAYEAAKLAPQATGDYNLNCDSSSNKKIHRDRRRNKHHKEKNKKLEIIIPDENLPCLDRAMKERAKQVLTDAGVQMNFNEIKVTVSQASGSSHFVSIVIPYKYSFFAGAASGLSIKNLKAEAGVLIPEQDDVPQLL